MDIGWIRRGRTRKVRWTARARSMLAAITGLGLGLALTVCSSDGGERLAPVRNCKSHDDCVDADARYDRCAWVCEGKVTYCIVSCETASDCRGRSLPNAYVYCDIPRPGDGFCNSYDHDFGEDACVQEVDEIPD